MTPALSILWHVFGGTPHGLEHWKHADWRMRRGGEAGGAMGALQMVKPSSVTLPSVYQVNISPDETVTPAGPVVPL